MQILVGCTSILLICLINWAEHAKPLHWSCTLFSWFSFDNHFWSTEWRVNDASIKSLINYAARCRSCTSILLICLINCILIFATFTVHWFTVHLSCSVLIYVWLTVHVNVKLSCSELICLINWAKHAKPFCTVSSNYALKWKRERPWVKYRF